jgi:hypothetical protein
MKLVLTDGTLQKKYRSRGLKSAFRPVVHACNPSYSGGRDQED